MAVCFPMAIDAVRKVTLSVKDRMDVTVGHQYVNPVKDALQGNVPFPRGCVRVNQIHWRCMAGIIFRHVKTICGVAVIHPVLSNIVCVPMVNR